MLVVYDDRRRQQTFGIELYIGELSCARHEFRIYVELAASSSDQMAVL
jgi:hypothetical protein